jgi:hypothetical protein
MDRPADHTRGTAFERANVGAYVHAVRRPFLGPLAHHSLEHSRSVGYALFLSMVFLSRLLWRWWRGDTTAEAGVDVDSQSKQNKDQQP